MLGEGGLLCKACSHFSVCQRLMWNKACVRVVTREDGMALAPTKVSLAQVIVNGNKCGWC